jgi:hypothetical protein
VAGEQILNNCADFHELIEAGGLVDESANADFLQLSIISPGLGGTPRADRDAGKVGGRSDLVHEVFASVPGKVQVHQDQVWNSRLSPFSLLANKGQGLVPVCQVYEVEPEILFSECPFEEEDIGLVVLDHNDTGRVAV